jgi:ribonuclease-3
MSTSNIEINEKRLKILNDFQEKYNLKFKNTNLLNQAFVHTSYTNENNLDVLLSYEKLEFMGDAVLKLSVSEFLYENFKEYKEGELTKLRAEIVSDKNISNYAAKLGFEELILLGKNEKKQGGAKKESILACAFEALLGAILLENKQTGYKKAKQFLKENFLEDILNIEKKAPLLNPKATLQEYTQGINCKLPVYNLVKEEGMAHKKTFFVEVVFNDKVIGKGQDKSIKKAESMAASDALKKLGIIK